MEVRMRREERVPEKISLYQREEEQASNWQKRKVLRRTVDSKNYLKSGRDILPHTTRREDEGNSKEKSEKDEPG